MYSYVFFDGAINFYTSSLEGYIHLPNLSSTISIVNSIEKPCTSPALNALDYSLSDKYNASCFWNNEPSKDVSIYSNTSLINCSLATKEIDNLINFITFSDSFKTNTHLYYINNIYKTIR